MTEEEVLTTPMKVTYFFILAFLNFANGQNDLIDIDESAKSGIILNLINLTAHERNKTGDGLEKNDKKTAIVCILLTICLLGAFAVNLINANDDFILLQNFYFGYMGRRLLLLEKMDEKQNNFFGYNHDIEVLVKFDHNAHHFKKLLIIDNIHPLKNQNSDISILYASSFL